MSARDNSAAAWLAALYADPSDAGYQAEEPRTPTVEELHAALLFALEADNEDTAVAIATEIRRLAGELLKTTTAGQLFGSKAGIWRLH